MDKDKQLKLILNRIELIENELTVLKRTNSAKAGPKRVFTPARQRADGKPKSEAGARQEGRTTEYLAARAWAKKTLNLSLK